MKAFKTSVLAIALTIGAPAFAEAGSNGEASAAQGENELPFQPDGQWRLSSLDDGCSVSRDFVRKDDRVTLSFKRIHPASDVQFAIIGGPLSQRSGSLKAGFSVERELTDYRRIATASIGDREGLVFAGPLFGSADWDESDDLAKQTTDFVAIDPLETQITLRTRAIDKAVSALDQCVTDHLVRSGLDLEAHKTFETHATPKDIKDWAQKLQRDYPNDALRGGLQGPVPVRLIVDGSGRVTRCDVTNYLTALVLRQTACDLLVKHARFNPATGRDGQPVTDYYWTTVVYRMAGRGFSADAHGFQIRHD